MYELVQVGKNSYYIDCPAKIGIYRANDSDVYLIDSGNDKDAGKKALKILNGQGWKLRGILNTHSHADHIGGNKYLQQQTGCKVFCPDIEGAFTRVPLLEPTFLYGGYAPKELRHKFLMAAESDVCSFSDEHFPKEIEVIELNGHSFDMVGFKTPDGAVFIADCLSSRETLDKYGVGFLYSVSEYIETLEKIKAIKATVFIPSHAPHTEDITELADYNVAKVNEIADYIIKVCENAVSFESVLQAVFNHYELKMNASQHALIGSTLRSYLAWLTDSGKLTGLFEDNILKYKSV